MKIWSKAGLYLWTVWSWQQWDPHRISICTATPYVLPHIQCQKIKMEALLWACTTSQRGTWLWYGRGKRCLQELAPNILVTPLWPFVKPATLDWFVLIVSSSRSLFSAPSEPSLLRPLHPLSEEELFGGDGTGEEDDWKPLSELSLWHEAGLDAELEELM